MTDSLKQGSSRAHSRIIELLKIAVPLLVLEALIFSSVGTDLIGRMVWSIIAIATLPLLAVSGALLSGKLDQASRAALFFDALPYSSIAALAALLLFGNFHVAIFVWGVVAIAYIALQLLAILPKRSQQIHDHSDVLFALNALLSMVVVVTSLFSYRYWGMVDGNKVMGASWITPALMAGMASCFFFVSRQQSETSRARRIFDCLSGVLVIAVVMVLIFPQNLTTQYYHQHVIVEPAVQVLQSGGVLMQSTFSQYGEGPVALSVLSNGLAGLPLVELTALGWQILWTVLLILLAAIMARDMPDHVLARSIIIAATIAACALAFFGRRYWDYPSVFVIRFATPILVTFFLVFGGVSRRAFAFSGVIAGLAPYWNIESTFFVVALILWHAAYVVVIRAVTVKKGVVRLIVSAVAALSSFAMATLLYYFYVGAFPRFFIHFEIMAGYAQSNNWIIAAMDPNARNLFIFPLAVTAAYALLFIARIATRFFPYEFHSPRSVEIMDPGVALHHLVLLAALGSVYFIGRPVYWTIASGLIFASCALAVAAMRLAADVSNYSKPVQAAIIGFLLCFTAAYSFSADAAYGPKGRAVVGRWEPFWSALVAGRMPQIHANELLAGRLTEPVASSYDEVVKRYLSKGKDIELMTDDIRISGPMRMLYPLPSQLPLSAWLSDSMSLTRRDELMTAARSLRAGTIIIGPGPEHAAQLRKLGVPIRSVSIDIIDNLLKERRIRELEASADTTVYVVNDKS